MMVAFYHAFEDLREGSTIYFPSVNSSFLFFFSSGDQLAHTSSTHRSISVHSVLTSRDNCDRMFPDELRVSSFS